MFLIDEIEAACDARGLPINLSDRKTVPVGNCVSQFHVLESRAGRLVRQLEDHFRVHHSRRAGPLGARFKRLMAYDYLVHCATTGANLIGK
jgi:hypothetical protein